jgi:predicted DNA-binding antitoxin AbrB/MazE fold protein
MTVVEAVFERGVFRPVSPVALAEGAHVEVLVPEPVEAAGDGTLATCASVGILPHEDAEEILRIIEAEFEQVNPDEWR